MHVDVGANSVLRLMVIYDTETEVLTVGLWIVKVHEKTYSSPKEWIFTKKNYESIVYSHCSHIFRAVYTVYAKVIVQSQ